MLSILPVAAQNMPRVRQTIKTLAASPMHGRGYVAQGERKAAAYLRQRFRQLGLQPLAPNYTQPFTLDVNTFPGELQLRAQTGNQLRKTRNFRPGIDFIAEPGSGGGQVHGEAVVFDTLAFTQAAARRHWLATSLRNRAVVLSVRHLARLQASPNDDSLRNSLTVAAARITLVPQKLTASLSPTQSPQIQLQLLADRWPAPPVVLDIRVEAELRRQYPTQNIVGLVPGRQQPDSFLVVTAHYDHLGRMGARTYFPGANDNASGMAMLLELAAHYARPENQPACSIVFIAFGAEEAGLVGSRYFVGHPLISLGCIRFLLNLDLLGTGSEGATAVNGRALPAQFQLLQQLNARRHVLPALTARGQAANSDHFPFAERGVPALFLYTRGGPTAYHDVHDRADTLPLTAFAPIFGLLTDFMNALGAATQ